MNKQTIKFSKQNILKLLAKASQLESESNEAMDRGSFKVARDLREKAAVIRAALQS